MKPLKPLELDKYRGEWIALDPATNEVLGHGASLNEAERQAAQQGIEQPTLYRVPETDAFFVGSSA
jgi:hypothetical protein